MTNSVPAWLTLPVLVMLFTAALTGPASAAVPAGVGAGVEVLAQPADVGFEVTDPHGIPVGIHSIQTGPSEGNTVARLGQWLVARRDTQHVVSRQPSWTSRRHNPAPRRRRS